MDVNHKWVLMLSSCARRSTLARLLSILEYERVLVNRQANLQGHSQGGGPEVPVTPLVSHFCQIK